MSVYFAESCGYMKIGHSHDPVHRSTTITRLGKRPAEIAFDAETELIGWIPGDVWRERALHVQHLEHRVRGEWFRLDRQHVRDLIWADPCGVDLERMTAAAVLAAYRHPGLSRADIEAVGIQLLAPPSHEVMARLDALLTAST